MDCSLVVIVGNSTQEMFLLLTAWLHHDKLSYFNGLAPIILIIIRDKGYLILIN